MKTKLPLFIFSIVLLLSSALYAQVGIGTNKPAASAALEVTSDSNAKGLLIPRLTDVQRAAIKEPAEGLLIYQTSAPSGFYFFTNGEWKLIISQTNGKDLSSNDYTTLEKTKLAAITGTNTGDQINISGNAGTATKLAAPKNINGVAFDGSADITITAAAAASAEDLTGTTLKSTVIGSSLTSVGTLGSLTVINPIVGSVTGNAATATTATTATSAGTATTATKLATARKINNVDFDGSADITIAAVASAEDLTGTTLKSTVTGSSLTSVGTLANLTVTNPIAGSVTGNAATVTTNANLTGVVTSVGNATSIANNAITNLMLANSAVANLSGTNTGDQDLSLLAPILSPTLSGTPKAPTAASGTNDTQLATTAFVYDATTGKFVDITTNQTIAGNKTFSSDIKVNGLTIGRGNGQKIPSIAIGNETLFKNTTGTGLLAVGTGALYNNTSGNFNIGIGNSSLYSNETGQNNLAIGEASLQNSVTGERNTAIGTRASQSVISNNNVSSLGYEAGLYNIGSSNTFLGAFSDQNTASSSITNSTAIGYEAKIDAANQIQLGNTSVTNVKTSGTLTAGAVTYPSTHGTTGQVLTTNGAGPLTWSSPASASAASAGDLTGNTLKSTVTGSSLTSVGTLTNLTVTNAISGSVTGNAGTATKLATARNINGVAFDGSADISIPTPSYAQVLLASLADMTAVTIGGISIRVNNTSSSNPSKPELEIMGLENRAFTIDVFGTVSKSLAGSFNTNADGSGGLYTPKFGTDGVNLSGNGWFRLIDTPNIQFLSNLTKIELDLTLRESNVSYKLTVLTMGNGKTIMRLEYYP